MKRRQFLQGTAASALVTSMGATLVNAATRPRPNILYVFDDQHRAASLPGEPYSPVVAPTLDAFRRANFSMDRCVSNYPLCTPYRGIFLTGRWPHQSGLWHNGAEIARNEISLGRVFKDQGYSTSYVGKWHLQRGAAFIPAGPDRQGFDKWHVWERTNDHYTSFTYDPDTGQRIQPKGWTPVLMTDQAIDIIKQQTRDQPWMMVVSYNPPHPPYNPPAEEQQVYAEGTLPMRPNVRLSNKDRPHGIPALSSEAGLHKVMLGYYGAITGIDKEFARLLKTLDETGQADDTIVVFTSDHGEMMGSQGRMQKNCPYEESIRVPFMIRYPNVTKPSGKSDTLFAAVDIYPTICGLAGVPVPKHCVGRDLSAVLRGETVKEPPQHVFLMNAQAREDDPDDDAQGASGASAGGHRRSADSDDAAPVRNAEFVTLPSYRGIRTLTHTYAVSDTGRWILFDNAKDPYQMKNLVEDPAQAGLMAQLDALIAAWLKQTKDPFPYADKVRRVAHLPT